MMGNGQITLVANAGTQVLRNASLRVEKACNTSDLRDRAMRDDARGTRNRESSAARELSQSETDAYAPLWHGPRLRPAFVAQVLGQVMTPEPRRDARSVFAAYEDGAGRSAPRGFDRRI